MRDLYKFSRESFDLSVDEEVSRQAVYDNHRYRYPDYPLLV